MITVEMYYDFASPFSYLANETIDRELESLSVSLKRIPVYLRGFDSFKNGAPFSSAKLSFLSRDLARSAEHLGIPLSPPTSFPVNALPLLRAAVFLDGNPLLDRFRHAGFRAAWGESRNVSDPIVALEIGASLGIDREALQAGMNSPEVKEKLKTDTAKVVARGAFGLPTFFVGDELFWGHDRIEHVKREVLKQLAKTT